MRFALFLLVPLILFAEETKYPIQPATYTLPGIVGKGGAGWIGTDHLLNLSPDIHVIVEIIKPAALELDFDEAMLREAILDVFSAEGVAATIAQSGDKPPLPFFDTLLMIQKIEGGYAFSIQGRLFEKVLLDRVVLPEEVAFQAITWEKQNLLIVANDQLKTQALASVKEIADVFLTRYRFFERQKLKLK